MAVHWTWTAHLRELRGVEAWARLTGAERARLEGRFRRAHTGVKDQTKVIMYGDPTNIADFIRTFSHQCNCLPNRIDPHLAPLLCSLCDPVGPAEVTTLVTAPAPVEVTPLVTAPAPEEVTTLVTASAPEAVTTLVTAPAPVEVTTLVTAPAPEAVPTLVTAPEEVTTPEEDSMPKKKRRKKGVMATQEVCQLDAMRAYYLSVLLPFVAIDSSVETRVIGMRLRVPVDLQVHCVQDNPKFRTSKSYHRYEKYKHATTLKELFELGATNADIEWDVYRRLITITRATEHTTKL